jgi:hypothetical protein
MRGQQHLPVVAEVRYELAKTRALFRIETGGRLV